MFGVSGRSNVLPSLAVHDVADYSLSKSKGHSDVFLSLAIGGASSDFEDLGLSELCASVSFPARRFLGMSP
jgi:hypothetical protein